MTRASFTPFPFVFSSFSLILFFALHCLFPSLADRLLHYLTFFCSHLCTLSTPRGLALLWADVPSAEKSLSARLSRAGSSAGYHISTGPEQVHLRSVFSLGGPRKTMETNEIRIATSSVPFNPELAHGDSHLSSIRRKALPTSNAHGGFLFAQLVKNIWRGVIKSLSGIMAFTLFVIKKIFA